jgi:superfamily II DNA or RNA helicase
MRGSNDLQRLFNSKQRQELYNESGAKCQLCGDFLEPGWHADHVVPFSKGGPTTLDNGQALCPTCNLAKSDTGIGRLRSWQQTALQKFAEGAENFLAVACPGAGKTTFALEGARRLKKDGAIERIYIVVPRDNLKRQWAVEAAKVGLHIDNTHKNQTAAIARDYDGVAVTYAQVAASPGIHYTNTQMRTLVIFDEIHHANDDENVGWGTAIQEAFSHGSCRRLLLSGTPFRTDGRPIPFVTYVDNVAVPHYSYGYGEALMQGIVRPIEFPTLTGEVGWHRASKLERVDLKDVDDNDVSHALASALKPDGAWIKTALTGANECLTMARDEMPDAGGLVIASTGNDARAYARLLKSICGEEPTVVLHDIEDSTSLIEEFARSTKRWIVAVQMVSEGVDIPRLSVGVYATRIRTELFFRQAVGRFIRRRGADDDVQSAMFIPHISVLVGYAQEIEREVEASLRDDGPLISLPERDGPKPMSDVTILPSFSAEHYDTIRSGERFMAEELAQAELALAQSGLRGTASQFLQAMRMMREAQPTVAFAPIAESRTLVDEKQMLRDVIKEKVNLFCRHTGRTHDKVYGEIKGIFGQPLPQATLEGLQLRLELVNRWLRIRGLSDES